MLLSLVALFWVYLVMRTVPTDVAIETNPVFPSPVSSPSEIPQQVEQIEEVVEKSPIPTYTAKTVVPTPSPSLEPTVEATSCTQQCEETYEQKKKTTCTALLSAGGSGSYAACLGNIGKEKQACMERC